MVGWRRADDGEGSTDLAGFPLVKAHVHRRELSVVDAVFNGQVIASSSRTILLEGNYYFPPEHVNHEFLQRTWMKSLCPWKGVASYYHVTVDGERDRNAAWTYRHPSPLARKIRDHIAFWGRVQITNRAV